MLLDCPTGAKVALCRAQKTVTVVTGRVWGLAGPHHDIGGGFRGVLSTFLP